MELVAKRISGACIASVLTSDYGHRIALSWTGRGVLPEEPTAVVPHGGVREGRGGQLPRLLGVR